MEPRLRWYLLLEPVLTLSARWPPFKASRCSTDRGNGYSDRDEGGDAGEMLSTDGRESQEAMTTIILPNDRALYDHCDVQLLTSYLPHYRAMDMTLITELVGEAR